MLLPAAGARRTPAATAEGGEQPRPAPRLRLDAAAALDLLGGRRGLLLELVVLLDGGLARLLRRLAGLARRRLRAGDQLGPAGVELAARAVDAGRERLAGALQRRGDDRLAGGERPGGRRRRAAAAWAASSRGTTSSFSAFCAALRRCLDAAGPRSAAALAAAAWAASRRRRPGAAAASRAASTRGRDGVRGRDATAGAGRPRRRAATLRRRPWAPPPSGRRRAPGRPPRGRPRPGGRAARPRGGRPRWPPPRCGRSPPGARRR